MEHYVTLFDRNFVPQGLALHESLQRHSGPFTLWVLCIDEVTRDVLEQLNCSNLRTIPLLEVEREVPELIAIKPGRTRAEYCWTLTPFTPDLVFRRDPTATRVTYVDADVFFFSDPGRLLEGFAETRKAVQITEHAYDPAYDQSAVSGRFCVQFMTFVRGASQSVLRRWQQQCLEWCFARPEPGRFGDQKYLDDWPERFTTLVHILHPQQGLQAPWNARMFSVEHCVGWHFHGLRLLPDMKILLHRHYVVPDEVIQIVYLPYVAALKRQLARVPGHFGRAQSQRPARWREWLRMFRRLPIDGLRAVHERSRIVSLGP